MSRLRRKYAHALGGIAVPDPFDLDAFCASIEQNRERPLRMHVLPLQAAAGFCGLYLEMPAADHVFFPTGTSTMHQQHIVVHELVHLLRGHRGNGTNGLPIGPEMFSALLPDVDPTLIRTVLGRSGYADPDERDAETLASLILDGAQRPTRSGSDDPIATRIEAALG